ncbi:conserved hypothetical protein [Dehalogenimonas lykanthroporepellens BL-DC-9]|jgi:uncharacterized protein YoxC|nr:conserved hypothetical protein [Dehalogenimonas lykanthroporepellens BL-DC-9]
MGIEWYRDLVIIIAGVLIILISFVILLLVISIHRKTNRIYDRSQNILRSLENTSGTIEGFTQYATRELVKPVIEIAALFQGLKTGIDSLFKRRKQP